MTKDQQDAFTGGMNSITTKEWRSMSIHDIQEAMKLYNQQTIGYNEIDSQIYNLQTHLPINDKEYAETIYDIEIFYGNHQIPKGTEDKVINTLAYLNAFNPIEDFVKQLPAWDQKDRMATFLQDIWQIEDNDYHRAASALLILSIVLRAQNTKKYIKQDQMFVFTGPAGIRKSSFIQALAIDERLHDDTATLDGKDNNNLMLLASTLINEIAEISSIDGRSVNRIKAFISNKSLTFRVPFAHNNTTIPFHNTLIGTTNDPQILNDPTGNRKFIMIDVKEKAQTDLMTKDYMSQVYAEALYKYKQWHQPWLDIDSLAKAMHLNAKQAQATAISQQNQHSMFNPIVDVIHAIVENQADQVIPGLTKKLDDHVIKIVNDEVVALNINALRTSLDLATIGMKTADAEDIKDAISKARSYKIQAQKAIEAKQFKLVQGGYKKYNIPKGVRGWYIKD